MKKDTLFIAVIIALLLLNFGTLGFLFLQQKQGIMPHRPPRPDKLIIEKLQLNDAQIEQFEQSKRKHRQGMNYFDQEAAQLHATYFSLLKTDTYNEAEKDSLEKILAQNQTQKDSITFLHFEELKSICTKEQLPKFNILIEEIGEILTSPPPKHRR